MHNNKLMILALSALSTAAMATAGGVAQAETAELQAAASPLRVDFEIDPIAYAFSGYSLHAGLSWERFRLDLGTFALDVPEALHGTKGLDVYGSGFGAKLDYHPFEALSGFFVGAQLSQTRETVTHRATSESSTETHLNVGARVGYRIPIASGFYALPWVGVDVSLTDRKQTVAGVDYDQGRAIFFPTIHIGKEF